MREGEWDALRAVSLSEYAEEMVRNKGLTLDEATARAERQTDDLLTDGPATSGRHLFVAERADSGERVG
jgi:hypothetical protein